jgi:hypothetical protein
MPGGRPSIDLQKVSKEMLEWSLKEDSFNLCGFSGEYEYPPSVITKYARENEQFKATYEIVKARLAKRREQGLALGLVHVKAYDLNSKHYDLYLKEDWKEEKEFESSLKKQENAVYSQESAEKYSALMNQLSAMQSPSRSCESSNNKDNKS